MGSWPRDQSWFTHNWLIFCNAHTHTHTHTHTRAVHLHTYLHRDLNYLAIRHMCSQSSCSPVSSLQSRPSSSLGNYCCLSVLIKMYVCLAGLESFGLPSKLYMSATSVDHIDWRSFAHTHIHTAQIVVALCGNAHISFHLISYYHSMYPNYNISFISHTFLSSRMSKSWIPIINWSLFFLLYSHLSWATRIS